MSAVRNVAMPGSTMEAPREFAGGARLATWLIAIAPWLAAVYGGLQTFLFAPEIESPPLQRAAHVAVVLLGGVSAFVISRHLWRGVHDGRLSPVRLLLWSTLPTWLLAEAVGQFLAVQYVRGGIPFGYAEASILRLAGQFLAWSLTGSVIFGFSVATFLWRPPARRLPGVLLAWVALAPLALWIAWAVITAQVESMAVRSALIGLSWISLPITLGLVGGALGDAATTHPRRNWVVGAGLGTLVVTVAAMAMATSQALNDTIVASSAGEDAGAMAPAFRFAIVAILLAGIPLISFALRTRILWSVPTLVVVALPLAGIVLAWAIDAAGPGPEHGLVFAYPRRLYLLVAYALLVPSALLALRRRWKTADTLRDGVALAAALAGLQWLALGPGLLLFAPSPAVDRAPTESSAAPTLADDLPPPPPPPPLEHRAVASAMPPDGKSFAVEEVESDGNDGATISPYMPALPTATATAEVVTLAPDVLSGLRISGENPLPPREWYGAQERLVVTVAVEIDAAGRVTRVQLLKRSGNDRLDELVMDSLMRWRYRPWAVDGRAVPVRSSISFIFVAR